MSTQHTVSLAYPSLRRRLAAGCGVLFLPALLALLCIQWPAVAKADTSFEPEDRPVEVERYGYPPSDVDPLFLREQLRQRRFAELEAIFATADTRLKEDYHWEKAFRRLSGAFSIADATYLDLAAEWSERAPESWVPHLVRAEVLRAMAWQVRGTEFVRETRRASVSDGKELFKRSAEAASQALAINPGVMPALLIQMTAAGNRGGRDDLDALLAAGLKQYPYSMQLRTARMHYLSPRWGGSFEAMDEAAREAEAHVAENPGLKVLRGYLAEERGHTLGLAGKWELALERFDVALSYGDFAPFFDSRANALLHLGRLDEALTAYDQALALEPHSERPLRGRADVLYQLGRADEALRDIDLALKLEPTHEWGQTLARRIHRMPVEAFRLQEECRQRKEGGDVEGALKACGEAEAAAPRNPDLRLTTAGVLWEAGRRGAARASVRSALELEPGLAHAQAWLGFMAYQEADYPACVEGYTRAIDGGLEASKSYLHRADCYRHLEQDEAVKADLIVACELGEETACGILNRHDARQGNETLALAALGGCGVFAVVMVGRLRRRQVDV